MSGDFSVPVRFDRASCARVLDQLGSAEGVSLSFRVEGPVAELASEIRLALSRGRVLGAGESDREAVRALTWLCLADGGSAKSEGAAISPAELDDSAPLPELLDEARLRADRLESLMTPMGGLGAVPVADLDQLMVQLQALPKEAEAVFMLADGVRSVARILRDAGPDEMLTARILAKLVSAGLLKTQKTTASEATVDIVRPAPSGVGELATGAAVPAAAPQPERADAARPSRETETIRADGPSAGRPWLPQDLHEDVTIRVTADQLDAFAAGAFIVPEALRVGRPVPVAPSVASELGGSDLHGQPSTPSSWYRTSSGVSMDDVPDVEGMSTSTKMVMLGSALLVFGVSWFLLSSRPEAPPLPTAEARPVLDSATARPLGPTPIVTAVPVGTATRASAPAVASTPAASSVPVVTSAAASPAPASSSSPASSASLGAVGSTPASPPPSPASAVVAAVAPAPRPAPGKIALAPQRTPTSERPSSVETGIDDLRRAESLLASGAYKSAGKLLRGLRTQRAEDPIVWVLSGQHALDSGGSLAAAQQYADRALKLDERSYRAWLLKGSVLQFLGQTRPAATAYARAIALDPQNPQNAELRLIMRSLGGPP